MEDHSIDNREVEEEEEEADGDEEDSCTRALSFASERKNMLTARKRSVVSQMLRS